MILGKGTVLRVTNQSIIVTGSAKLSFSNSSKSYFTVHKNWKSRFVWVLKSWILLICCIMVARLNLMEVRNIKVAVTFLFVTFIKRVLPQYFSHKVSFTFNWLLQWALDENYMWLLFKFTIQKMSHIRYLSNPQVSSSCSYLVFHTNVLNLLHKSLWPHSKSRCRLLTSRFS